ncbi:MAG: hypothetical protein ACNYNX_05010 [Leucobacter sp.]
MAVRNLTCVIIGCALALWMGVGRWLFGIGGELTIWYLPLIAIPYALLQLWTVRRFRIAADRGRRVGRAPFVALILSWVCALGFGFTVPDLVGGELVSILSHLAGPEWLEMSIALCNPFGIVAFTTAIIALAFAAAAGREPRAEEDDADVEGGMVSHPLEH